MSEQAQLVFLLSRRDTKRKDSGIPSRVISPNKGPLSLITERPRKRDDKQHPPSQQHSIGSKRRDTLTRFPVPLLERPMELVEKELGTLSCSQLRDSIKNWPTQLPAVQRHSLPYPPPPLVTRPNRSFAHHMARDNSTPMNITITYNNRQASLTPPHTKPNALTNVSVLARSITTAATEYSHSQKISVPGSDSSRQELKRTLPWSCWPHLQGGASVNRLRRPLLNKQTILQGQGLAMTHKHSKQQRLEPIETTETQ